MAARASSVVSRCIFRNLRIFAAAFALLAATFGAGELRAQALPKNASDFAGHLAALAGLDKLKLGPVTVHANWAETKTTLRGEAISLIVFKQSGVSKPYIAVVPANFKLTSFVPIPSGSPIQGVSFRNMAFVYVPKGAAKSRVSTGGLPQPIRPALQHSGSTVDLKEGLNIFGEADFSVSNTVKKALSAVGLNNYRLPLNGTLSPDLFQHDPKTASRKIKDQILNALRLDLKLPTLRIPGMPNTVAVEHARFSIVSRKFKDKHEIFAGVTGDLDIHVAGKKIDFAFYILAGKPGAQGKLTLKGDTKSKITLPFFHPLDLTGLSLAATKSGGKWDVVVNAKARLNNKSVDVAVHHDPKDGTSAEVTGAIKLSDLLPGGASIPGLTDVEFDRLDINRDFIEVAGKIKGLDTVIAVFKRNGKTYIAVNNPRPIKISSFISAAKGTPLDDASFQHMTYIWAPRGGAESGLSPSAFPPDIAYNVKQVVKTVDLKEGLNVIGRMAITKTSKLGSLLTKVGAYKSALPLVGKLSPKIFHPGSGTSIKNEILDNLNFKLALAKMSLPGMSSVATIRNTNLTIKGVNKGGTREIDIAVAGELDVKAKNETVVFDYTVDVKKQAGKPAEVSISGHTAPGTKVTVNLFHPFELDSLKFSMTKEKAGWKWRVAANTKFGSKPLDVSYVHDPSGASFLDVQTKMTVAEIVGKSDLPGLDDVHLNWIQVYDRYWRASLNVKGTYVYVNIFKPAGASEHLVAVTIGPPSISPDKFIPGTSNTPLKDVTFNGLSFVLAPAALAGRLYRNQMPRDIAWRLRPQAVPGNIVLKSGLNVFGKMEIHPTGEMAKLLKKVGITTLTLPLNGGFSPKAFAKNLSGTAIKNAILDQLDIKVALPPLDIPGVDKVVKFSNGRLIIKGKSPKGQRGIYVDFKGDATFGSHGNVEVDVKYDRTSGGTSNFWVEVKGPIKLSEIPEVNKIPHAGEFALTDLKISEHGIEAKTTLAGRATDIALFKGSGWTAAITQKNFSITELIPPLKHTPLKHIGFPSATLLISDGGIDKHYGDLGAIAQDVLKELYSDPGALVQIASGITFIAGFDPNNAGAMKDAVKGIGVHEKVMLQGTIGGVFGGGTPLVRLKGILSSAGKPGSMPKFMKFAKNAELDFFINVSESGQDFDFELGLGVGVNTKIGSDELLFDAKVKLQIMEEGFGIDIEGQMLGTWHKPFGIPFALSNVTLEVGTQEDGAIKLGFAGTTIIGADTFSIAADAELLPEALGAPQAIAFKAKADEVDLLFLDEVALQLVSLATGKAGVHLPISKIPQPKIKNVLFAFATPGAEDPDLGLVSEGFALKGTFFFLGKELGDVNAAVGPTSGISIKGKLDDFDLGPLKLTKNDLNIQVPIKRLPTFHIHSHIAFLDISERFLLDATSKTIKFSAQANLGPDFIADFDLALRGLDLNSAKVDPKTADFYMKGLFEAKMAKFIRNSAKKTLKDVFNELGTVFAAGEKVVADAKKKVERLQKKVNAARAKVRKEKAAAEAKVQHAEDRVNSLNGSLSHAWDRYHHCHGWGKYACKVKYGIEIGGLKGSIKIADEVLNEVKSAIKHFPIDLDPLVAAQIILKDAALVALDAAKLAIEGLDELDKFLSEGLADLVDALNKTGAGAAIEIDKASFEGDLRGVIEHDAPLDLALEAKVFGVSINEKFAFKMKDIAWSGEQLGLMGLYALEHLINKLMGDLPAGLRHHARSAVGRKIDATTASRDRALAAASADFAKQATMAKATVYADESAAAIQKKIAYNQHAAALQAKYAAETDAYVLKLLAESDYNPLDHEGASLTYKNDFFEVGHTGLCLTNEGGEIVQHPCAKDKVDSQQWTTVAVTEKDGSSLGYVQMTQGKQCASPAGKYVTVTETFGKNYTYQRKNFQGDGTLSMGGCYPDKIYHWKILKHGADWVKMVNRVTSHCIHFENSNALPGKAKGVWGPCMGTANQVYRVAGSLTPIYHKAGFALRNDFNSLCLGDGTPDVPMVGCDKPARYDYMVDVRGFIKFVNTTTGKCLQPKNYTLKTALTEKTCSQLDYQWWEIVHVPGGWSVKNAQTKHCDRVGGAAGDPATQDACTSWSQAILIPLIDATSGVTFQSVKGAAAPTGGAKFNINFTLAQRKYNCDLWFHHHWQAEAGIIHSQEEALNNKLNKASYTEFQHQECGPQYSPAYKAYKVKYRSFFQWKEEYGQGQKCAPFVPRTTTHLACPTPKPLRILHTCTKTCSDLGYDKDDCENMKHNYPQYMNSQMGCTSKYNPAYNPWNNKYYDVVEWMRAGRTCGPNGTAIRTTGGQRNQNTCPPPPPTSTKNDCQMVWAYLTASEKKKMRDRFNELQATWETEYRRQYKNPTAAPEAPQYLCRARHKQTKTTGFSFDNLLIGIVDNGKCVYASDLASNFITVYKGEWGKPIATDDYEILMEGKGVEWVDANNRIPQRAMALGYKSSVDRYRSRVVGRSDTHLQSVYACRVINRDTTSTVGWTLHGHDCTYLSQGKVITNFGQVWYDEENYTDKNIVQMLVRDVGKVVHIDLAEKP